MEDVSFESVSVLGDGAWAAVLADLLAIHHRQVWLYTRSEAVAAALAAGEEHPALPGVRPSPRVKVTTDLAEAAQPEVLFAALRADDMRGVMERLGAHVHGGHVVISAGRGLESSTAARMTEIICQETCVRKVGALAGPRLTVEMTRGAPGATVVASPMKMVRDDVQARLNSRRFRVYTSSDLPGAEAGAALCSSIALLAGAADGLGLGPGVQAVVLTRGLAEVSRLGVALGGKVETMSGLGTLGVLLGACLSQGNADYRLGAALVTSPGVDLAEHPDAEAYKTSGSALELARRFQVEMPLTRAAAELLAGASARDLIERLMSRPARAEAGGR